MPTTLWQVQTESLMAPAWLCAELCGCISFSGTEPLLACYWKKKINLSCWLIHDSVLKGFHYSICEVYDPQLREPSDKITDWFPEWLDAVIRKKTSCTQCAMKHINITAKKSLKQEALSELTLIHAYSTLLKTDWGNGSWVSLILRFYVIHAITSWSPPH